MSDSKNEVTETERGTTSPTPQRRSKKAMLKHSCKKYWWVHLITLCITIVVVIIIAVYAVVPAVAQGKVNAAHLEIQGVNVLNPEPNKYLMQINSTIKTDGQVKASIDPFTADMYLEDAPGQPVFARLPIPHTNANKHQNVNISSEIEITNMAAFTQFNTWFANNETVRITLNGKTRLQPKGLVHTYTVKFKKTLELKALNKLKGTTVSNGKVSFEAGKNFNGTAHIPNQSLFTIELGDTVFDNYANGEHVGKLYIDNLTLKPGNNEAFVSGTINQTIILSLLQQKPYCNTGIIPFSLIGDGVKSSSGKNLAYFADALAHTNQTVNLDVKSILKNSGIPLEVGCL